MNMMRSVAGVTAAMALVACSADDDAASADTAPAMTAPSAAANATGSSATSTTSPACPATAAPDAGALVARPASPVAACSGYYGSTETSLKLWLHVDAESQACRLGEDITLRADGTATIIASDRRSFEGTWKGDRTYFTVEYQYPGKNLSDGADRIYDLRYPYALIPSE